MIEENPNGSTPEDIRSQGKELPAKPTQTETPKAAPETYGEALKDLADGLLTNTNEGGSEQQTKTPTEATNTFMQDMREEMDKRLEKFPGPDKLLLATSGAIGVSTFGAIALGNVIGPNATMIGFASVSMAPIAAYAAYGGYEGVRAAIKVLKERRGRGVVSAEQNTPANKTEVAK
jgi:hypothetical protein